jgi:hypothetical protein
LSRSTGRASLLYAAESSDSIDRVDPALILCFQGGTRQREYSVNHHHLLRRHEPLPLESAHHLGIHQLSSQLPFQIDHRLLVFVPFHVLSDSSIPLSLLLIAQFTNGFVILLLGF